METPRIQRAALAGGLASLLMLGCGTEEPSGETAVGPASDATTPPNVLFIVWDTVRADRLQPYGHDRPTTPRLAEFARQCVVFERAVSPATWTLPSHASLFTGLPVRSHGTLASHKWLNHSFVTLAERFQEAGYATYSFSANPFVAKETNLTQGFQTVEHPWDDPWRKRVRSHTKAKLIEGDDSSRHDLEKDVGPVAQQALMSWLGRRKKPRPFFAFLNYMEAHIPRMPALEARRQVMTRKQIQASLTVSQKQKDLHAYSVGHHEYDDRAIDVLSAVYDASLVELDRFTGELLDRLQQDGLLENTIVVLTSDHGENLGEHHLFCHKFSVHNTLVRVPLLLKAPGLRPRRVAEEVPVHELYPTLLRLAGLTDEDAGLLSAPGSETWVAVAELLETTPAAVQRLKERFPDLDTDHWLRVLRSVERNGFKLIQDSAGKIELYDVNQDPGEERDLAGSRADVVRALERQLGDWLEQVPAYDPASAGDGDRRANFPDELLERLEGLGYVGER